MACLAGRVQVFIRPVYQTARPLNRLRRTLNVADIRRYFGNGRVPPLNEPLPGVSAAPSNCAAQYVTQSHQYKTRVSTLENGIKVASEDSFGQFSTVGVVIDAGSRYEVDYPAGLSHVIEKLSFQSTSKFSSNEDIMNDLETVGGMADCTAFRDAIVYATSCFTHGLPMIMEVLSQAVLHPQLAQQEVEEQKMVVQFELENLEYRPDPEPALTDLVHAAAFRDNTLGLPKLCPPESFSSIDSTILREYMKRYYSPSRMVVAGVNVDHEDLVELTRRYFVEDKPIWHKDGDNVRSPDESLAQYTGGIIKDHRTEPRINPGPTPLPELGHISVGIETVPYDDPDFFAFTVLNTMMGGGGSFSAGGPGKGMYSRLYLNVLNKYHWIYSATAYHHSYADSGLFCIHASAHPSQLRDLVQVIVKEYFQLTNGDIHLEEVSRAKKQLQSMLMMNLESRVIVFEDIGRQVLGLGMRTSPQELYHRIEAVTIDDVRRVSARMLTTNPSVAALGNLGSMPKYEDIQSAFANKGNFSASSRFFLFRNR